MVLTPTRAEAEQAALDAEHAGALCLPPFDSDLIIAGQGTSCFEALQDGPKPDVIFCPVGGGGLISGTWLAAQLLCPDAAVIGGEPAQANDAARSFRSGRIERGADKPDTVADGAATPAVSARTFAYVQQLQDIIEISEAEIIAWTRRMALQLKITAEPTSCVAAAAAAHWLAAHPGKTVLVILSGGNIDPATHRRIWQDA